MLRNTIAVIAGLIASKLIIYFVEMISHGMYPLSVGVDLKDPEVLKTLMEQAPKGVLLLLALGWLLGSFVGSLGATLISKTGKEYCGYITGVVLLASAIANMLIFNYPIWFGLMGIVAIVIGTLTGTRMMGKKQIF